MINPPIENAARASEKNKRKNYKQFLFLGLVLGLPLQQQQQQHWKSQVNNLKKPYFWGKINITTESKRKPRGQSRVLRPSNSPESDCYL